MRVVTGLGFGAVWRFRKLPMFAVTALAILVLGLVTPSWADATEGCIDTLTAGETIGAAPKDLKVDHTCYVRGGKYTFSHVNIVAGGKLIFVEPTRESEVKQQDFWATSIIIENGGSIYAGVDVPGDKEMVRVDPYGTNGKTLTFHLYGKDPRGDVPKRKEGPGVSCAPIEDTSKFADCGIPLKKTAAGGEQDFWAGNGNYEFDLPGNVRDYFYQYSNLHGDAGEDQDTKQAGHFGYKVLALSYGGTLQLRGLNGTEGTTAKDIEVLLKDPVKDADKISKDDEAVITNSGMDWVRLAGVEGTKLTLDRKVNWRNGSEIVITSTDYLPEHSEVRTIQGDANNTDVVTLDRALEYTHWSKKYDIEGKVPTDTEFYKAVAAADAVTDAGKKRVEFLTTAETRAAVALLSRSIRVVSEGDKAGETFQDATVGRKAQDNPPVSAVAANPHYMYGGHVAFRQGFEKLQIQGVEFKQLGQGGLLGRYPVHFHMARKVPKDTYVIDSSVNESMTRWFVIHSTIGATLARNVGYKSIGHGYFLEDATETDNKLYSNIGIFARGSVKSAANDREVPGLLDAPNTIPGVNYFPLKYNSDSRYPSVFWVTNGWNALAGNMAAGAGTCGACYWYVPTGNHDMVDVGPMNTPMKWSGYSKIQADPKGPFYKGRAGLSPVQLYYKNYCSTAMHSLVISDGSTCTAFLRNEVVAVKNEAAPDLPASMDEDKESDASRGYYPRYTGIREPAYCNATAGENAPDSCTKVTCNANNPEYCAPSVFSHPTSSFNWADSNFSAIWLRKGYLLLDHSFLSDIQGPGVTLITGGDYTRANLPLGYWGITSNSIFVGVTQPSTSTYASEAGPLDASGKPACVRFTDFCLDNASGVTFPITAWSTEQRMYNVYDGPAYEDANAFLDIYPSKCASDTTCMYYGNTLGVRAAQSDFAIPGGKVTKGQGFLANAAIGWKQSNGFYYPPAFHSRNLFFNNVGIRHYVVEPLTFPGTYRTNAAVSWTQYAGIAGNQSVFQNWSDVDRQTELNDDDGSMTGFNDTISVNEDPFFRGPVQTAQCRSNIGVDANNACKGQKPPNPATARTSPYDYVTTALFPAYDPRDNTDKNQSSTWNTTCSNENCTGIPIYREYLTGVKGINEANSTREWATWMKNGCDGQLTSLRGKTRKVLPFDPYSTPPQPRPPNLDPTIAAFLDFDEKCPSPSVRMAGMNLGQRSVLTVNNGRYFIDTTQSRGLQESTKDLPPVTNPTWQRNISVFEQKKSYYVYFVFAKQTTHQIYQIYVGRNFDPKSITGVRVNISTLNKNSFSAWAGYPWNAYRDPDNAEIVDVDVDFSKVKQDADTNLDPTKLNAEDSYMDDTCQPHTYCSKVSENGNGGSKTTCGCNTKKLGVLGLLNPNYLNVCKNVCGHWAVKDIDCPKGGCLGFKFTLPDGFEAKDQFVRPTPLQFTAPKQEKGISEAWKDMVLHTTKTIPDKNTNAGGCHYTADQVPNDSNPKCKVAD